MTARAAEALELALWLHRVPSRRAALLGRPLPEGIGELLRVAPGAPDQVAAAALITGETETTILEAVRFYLQQILFHEDSDAYRVLGLRPDAPAAQAREHHRLLQRWLHPDRRGADEWESVYAGRVNHAWTQIRTPQSRANYDASLNNVSQDGGSGKSRSSGELHIPQSPVVPTSGAQSRNRSKTLTLVVLLVCGVLITLIAMRTDTPPEWRDPRDIFASASAQAAATVTNSEAADAAALVARLDLPSPTPTPTAAVVGAASAATSPPVPAKPRARPPAPPISRTNTRRVVAAEYALAEQSAAATPPRAPQPPHKAAALPLPLPTAAMPVPAASVPAVPEMPPAEVATIPDSTARMTQARQRAHEISAYLGDLGSAAPPVWNDLGVLRQAQAARAELHQRNGMPRRMEVRLREMQWRHTSDSAHLGSRYQAAQERGQVDIEFAWRENQWLISRFSLVPEA